MTRRCLCRCHDGSVDGRRRADGVSVTDAIEAAVACDSCRRHHCPALIATNLLNDPVRALSDAFIGEDGG
jgi:hypothetical protein